MGIYKKMFNRFLRNDQKKIDEFSLSNPVKTINKYQMNWHEDFIVELAKVVKPHVYIELGLYQCVLFNRILPYAEKLLGVDIEKSAGQYMERSDKVEFFNMCTNEFADKLRKDPIEIDMLFIDADHSKESVLNDFYNFFPFVSLHGLILLHDSHPKNEDQCKPGYCGTGYQAIEELSKKTDEYEMMTIPVPPGLTICRKRKVQLSWKEL